ncbi:MAG: hypothetical protein J7L20_00555 [Thermoplasmata archaeon]|nr:hypothetical protein [Thermoplasmata archaeon]
MNKLIFAIAVTFALIACTNIPVIAEQENTAKQVNTKCQDKAWYLGTLNLTMGSCRIYNLSFVPDEKEITLHVGKNDTAVGIDAYVIFNITVKPGGSIPTILWWKLGKPIRTGDGGFGAQFFFPGYPPVIPSFTRIIKGWLDFIIPPDQNNRTVTIALKAGALFGGRITEDGYIVHLVRVT